MVENNQQQPEIWRTTDYYPGYTFSNKGRVYSYRSNPDRFLVGSQNAQGYIQVGILDYNNEKQQPYLSRIIYMLFGDDPELLPYRHVDHINHKQIRNNNINNLRLATPKENNTNQGKKTTFNGTQPSSQYIGVSYMKASKKWEANFRITQYKKFRLGIYKYEKNAAYVYNQISRYFKPQEFWYNGLPDDFELPDETENRDQVVTNKINKIQNYLDSLT